jgi:hypothetical protein
MKSQPALRVIGLLATTGTVALLSACGGEAPAPPPAGAEPAAAVQAGPAAAPATDPAPANTECGTVPATGATKAKVVIRAGAIDCAQATDVLTRYFQQLTPADAARPDGAGPIVLGGWTCGSGSPTDPTTCSTEDGRQIDGVPVK